MGKGTGTSKAAPPDLYAGTGITPLIDGHAVSRISDFIVYSVEAAHISSAVQAYGPSTKVGATVAGQTSVKAPEKEAFDQFLPKDVDVVSVHSLHGPTVTTEGQPLVSDAVYVFLGYPLDLYNRLERRRASADGVPRSLYTIEGLRARFAWSRESSKASSPGMSI